REIGVAERAPWCRVIGANLDIGDTHAPGLLQEELERLWLADRQVEVELASALFELRSWLPLLLDFQSPLLPLQVFLPRHSSFSSSSIIEITSFTGIGPPPGPLCS